MSPNSQTELQPTVTYANILQQERYPTKEHAIVLDIGIGKEVEPINVRYVSRISQKRICMYLSTTNLAENLVQNVKQIKIKEHVLEMRPLYTKSKRILLSNVQPHTPCSCNRKGAYCAWHNIKVYNNDGQGNFVHNNRFLTSYQFPKTDVHRFGKCFKSTRGIENKF